MDKTEMTKDLKEIYGKLDVAIIDVIGSYCVEKKLEADWLPTFLIGYSVHALTKSIVTSTLARSQMTKSRAEGLMKTLISSSSEQVIENCYDHLSKHSFSS